MMKCLFGRYTLNNIILLPRDKWAHSHVWWAAIGTNEAICFYWITCDIYCTMSVSISDKNSACYVQLGGYLSDSKNLSVTCPSMSWLQIIVFGWKYIFYGFLRLVVWWYGSICLSIHPSVLPTCYILLLFIIYCSYSSTASHLSFLNNTNGRGN